MSCCPDSVSSGPLGYETWVIVKCRNGENLWGHLEIVAHRLMCLTFGPQVVALKGKFWNN